MVGLIKAVGDFDGTGRAGVDPSLLEEGLEEERWDGRGAGVAVVCNVKSAQSLLEPAHNTAGRQGQHQ